MMADNYTAAVPVIGCDDVLTTLTYFERTLGFTRQFIWGDPPVYAGVQAGAAIIYLTHDAHFAATVRERSLAPDLFLWVKGIEDVFRYHEANGAEIVEPLSARPWGARQYVIQEPNGYRLKIAEPYEDE